MLVVLTPTGGRPKAIENLNHYLTNQSDQDFKWIVLDDCEPRTNVPSRCDLYVTPDWVWNGENTQAKSLLRLLNEVNGGDLVLFCEDDDWYSKDYVKTMRKAFETCDLIGIKDPVYYNVKTNQHKQFKNTKHASLCSTGITGDKIKLFKIICENNVTLLDSILWRSDGFLFNSKHCIGIKGMAGREGIGIGHTMQGIPDANREYLKELIEEDIKRYD